VAHLCTLNPICPTQSVMYVPLHRVSPPDPRPEGRESRLFFPSDGYSRSGSGTCSGNTWGTRHVPCSLFPGPCSLKDSPPHKKKFAADAAKFSLRQSCGASRFARLTCSLFPVPCSHKTPLREHVFRVPCSLSSYGKTHRCFFHFRGSGVDFF